MTIVKCEFGWSGLPKPCYYPLCASLCHSPTSTSYLIFNHAPYSVHLLLSSFIPYLEPAGISQTLPIPLNPWLNISFSTFFSGWFSITLPKPYASSTPSFHFMFHVFFPLESPLFTVIPLNSKPSSRNPKP